MSLVGRPTHTKSLIPSHTPTHSHQPSHQLTDTILSPRSIRRHSVLDFCLVTTSNVGCSRLFNGVLLFCNINFRHVEHLNSSFIEIETFRKKTWDYFRDLSMAAIDVPCSAVLPSGHVAAGVTSPSGFTPWRCL